MGMAQPSWNRPRQPPARFYEDDDIPPPPPPPRRDYDYPPPPPPPPRREPPSYMQKPYDDYPPPPPPPRDGSYRGRSRGWAMERGRGGDRGGMRGRGRGRGRGSGYIAPPARLNQPLSASAAPKTSSAPSKPTWLSQSNTASASTTKNTDMTQAQSSSTTTASTTGRPTWLSQGTAQESAPSKPSWLNQSSSNSTTKNESNTSPKPAWLSQSSPQSASASGSTGNTKPSWLSTAKPAGSASTSSTDVNQPLQASSMAPNNSQQASTTISGASSTQTEQASNTSSPAWMPQANSKPSWLNNPMQQTANNCFAPKPVQSGTGMSVPVKHNVPLGTPQVKTAPPAANNTVTVPKPGEAGFISFKNSLQELCQKRGLAVPSYTCRKGQLGLVVSVEAANQKFQSSGIHKDRKEADQSAAWEALKILGAIPTSTPFNCKVAVKRPAPGTSAETVAKKLKGVVGPIAPATSLSYKSQLNEFCQKFHLPFPTYTTNRGAGGFVSTLIYNKKVYLSTAPQATKKLAEQNVAQFVLSKVNQAPPPVNTSGMQALQKVVHVTAQTQADGTAKIVSTSAIPAESVKDLIIPEGGLVISYKNRLQEYCQKNKKPLPVYDSCRVGKHFVCNVMVGNATYTATGCDTKKGSEQSAARVALQSLGQCTE